MFVLSRDVWWPASIFFLSSMSFTSFKKLIPRPSPDSNKSQIFLLSWALVLDLHRLHGCREERHSCSRSNIVVNKNVWSGRRISRRTIQLFFFLSSQLTEVPKNRSHSRLIQEYLFLTYSFPMTCVNPIEVFFLGWLLLRTLIEGEVKNLFSQDLFHSWLFSRWLGSSVKKIDCDNCSSWRKAQKMKRNCWQVWFSVRRRDSSQR